MATTDERLAKLEAELAQVRNKLGLDSQLPSAPSVPVPALKGWEELPVSFVLVGFSRDQYALRPEKFPGEPPSDRMVPRGDLSPTDYLYNPILPAWQNFQRWEQAGRPNKDRRGVPVDVRGRPIDDAQQFSPQ
jgi:hypothetical protein